MSALTRVRDRLIDWLAQKASDYLVWVHEREIAGQPECPDCSAPESFCRCDEEYERERMLGEAYAEGGRDAWRHAQAEFGDFA